MAEAKRDYYEVLGVSKDADAKDIRAAFRQLALKEHPDRNKEPGAEERFKAIAEAYAVLSDPEKRRAYDERGFGGTEGFSAQDLFGGIDFGDLLGGLDLGFGAGQSIFERFFAGRGGRRGKRHRGANVEVGLMTSLERALRGGQETLRIPRTETCSACDGSGAQKGTPVERCKACEGRGQLVDTRDESGVWIQQIRACPSCGGSGKRIGHPCDACHGSGQTTREEVLELKIPVGFEEGMVLSIPGHGQPSPDPKGTRGDLLVRLESAPDRRFERHGVHLVRAERIDVADAVLGTTLEVPTLEGVIELRVPPGTQPGTMLRARGMGLPHFGGDRRGDLLVEVGVEIPARLDPKVRELYERIRGLRPVGSAEDVSCPEGAACRHAL